MGRGTVESRASWAIIVGLLVLHPAAHAASLAKLCRRACSDEIAACVAAGGHKATCRRQTLQQCRQAGLQTCMSSGESFSVAGLSAPSVTATAVASSAITLTWTASSLFRLQGYSVERSLNASGGFIAIATLGSSETTYADVSLASNTTYYYRVAAFARKGSPAYSNVASATTFPPTVAPTTSTTTTTTSAPVTTTTTIPVTGGCANSTVIPSNGGTFTGATSGSGTMTGTCGSTGASPERVFQWTPTVSGTATVQTCGAGTSFDTVLYMRSADCSAGPSVACNDDACLNAAGSNVASRVTVDVAAGQTYFIVVDGFGGAQGTFTLTVTPPATTTTTQPPTTTTSTTSTTTTTRPTTTSTTSTTTTTQPTTTTTRPTTTTTTIQPTTTTTSTSTTTTRPTTTTTTTQPTTTTTSTTTTTRPTTTTTSTTLTTTTTTTTTTMRPTTTTSTTTSTTTTTTAPNGALSTPTGVTAAAITCSQVSVQWNASSGGTAGLYGYNIYRNGTFTKQVLAPATTAMDESGLIANNVYGYNVVAVDNAGNQSGMSATVMTNTPQCTVSSGGRFLWARTFVNNTNADSAYIDALAVDSAGNLLVTGRIWATVDLGGGYVSPIGLPGTFVAKYSPTGAYLWARQIGNASPSGIAVDAADNVVVTGSFVGSADFGAGSVASVNGTYDGFVAKYSGSGAYLWARSFGETGADSASAVTVDGGGNVVLTGQFQNTVDFGGGPLTSTGSLNIFVAKYSSTGTYVWAKRTSGSGYEFVKAIAADASGNAILTGYFSGTVDFGGGLLSSAGQDDVFVAKFSAAGAHLWSMSAGGTAEEVVADLALDASGNVILTGTFYGSVDFGTGLLMNAGGGPDIFLVKYSSDGSPLWSERFGGTFGANGDSAAGVAVDRNGNILLTGQEADGMTFGGSPLLLASATYVAKLTPDGAPIWSQAFAASTGTSVATDGSNVIVAGGLKGTANFGGGSVFSAGWTGFITEFAP